MLVNPFSFYPPVYLNFAGMNFQWRYGVPHRHFAVSGVVLSSMRNTVTKTSLGGSQNEYAQNMYEDMLYDELANSVTKSAGFGLADQIYLQLS